MASSTASRCGRAHAGFDGIFHDGGTSTRCVLVRQRACCRAAAWQQPGRAVTVAHQQMHAKLCSLCPEACKVPPLLAWQVPEGEWLLSNAASSTLGRMVIQLAKHYVSPRRRSRADVAARMHAQMHGRMHAGQCSCARCQPGPTLSSSSDPPCPAALIPTFFPVPSLHSLQYALCCFRSAGCQDDQRGPLRTPRGGPEEAGGRWACQHLYCLSGCAHGCVGTCRMCPAVAGAGGPAPPCRAKLSDSPMANPRFVVVGTPTLDRPADEVIVSTEEDLVGRVKDITGARAGRWRLAGLLIVCGPSRAKLCA